MTRQVDGCTSATRVLLADVPQVDPAEIRRRMGPYVWEPPKVLPDGFAMVRRDQTRSVIVSVSRDYPDNPGDVAWIHASIAPIRSTEQVVGYDELCDLKRGVWGPDGWAFQVFAARDEHVNIRGNALHLWGRVDGRRAHPNFGHLGTI